MGADEQSDYGPTWYSGVTPLPPPRTPLNYDLDVDVCVIGGGLCGLAAAPAGGGPGRVGGGLGARPGGWGPPGAHTGRWVPGGFSPTLKKMFGGDLPPAPARRGACP